MQHYPQEQQPQEPQAQEQQAQYTPPTMQPSMRYQQPIGEYPPYQPYTAAPQGSPQAKASGTSIMDSAPVKAVRQRIDQARAYVSTRDGFMKTVRVATRVVIGGIALLAFYGVMGHLQGETLWSTVTQTLPVLAAAGYGAWAIGIEAARRTNEIAAKVWDGRNKSATPSAPTL